MLTKPSYQQTALPIWALTTKKSSCCSAELCDALSKQQTGTIITWGTIEKERMMSRELEVKKARKQEQLQASSSICILNSYLPNIGARKSHGKRKETNARSV
jgi:hypothetical protein